MRVHRTLVVAVGVGSLTVLAAGCGGSSKPSTISGGPVAQTTSATPTAPSPFHLPSGTQINLTIASTGDAKKDAVAQAVGNAIQADYEAEAGGGAHDVNLAKYYTGTALGTETANISAYLGRGKIIGGTDRFYKVVPTISASHAGATYCEDQTQTYDLDVKTGKHTPNPPGSDNYVMHQVVLVQGSGGAWQVSNFTSLIGAAQCE